MRGIKYIRGTFAIVIAVVMLSILAVAAPCNPELAAGAPGPSGRILFSHGQETWVMDGDGAASAHDSDRWGIGCAESGRRLADKKLTRITAKDQLAGRVKFSPDGKALIYTHFVGTGTTAIYRYDISSGVSRRLTTPRPNDSDYVVDWY
jgi:hypothetical protein